MAENKTRATGMSVAAFIDAVPDPQRRDDAREICTMMEQITGEPPAMWGASIVGFGKYRYLYESGHGGEWALTGFSPRANALTLYIMGGFPRHQALMDQLGKYKTGKSCLYLKRLTDVDRQVLETLIAECVAYMRATYDTG